MKLYCVRHAEAEAATSDAMRQLTIQGQMDIERVAKYLGQQDLHIRHIMHSELLRAQQTAAILAKHLHIEDISECPNLLSGDADVGTLVDMINSWQEDTMIVGHLPMMAKLISALVIKDENFFPIVNYPPGCIVSLDHYEGDRWIINWLLRPSIVPTCFQG